MNEQRNGLLESVENQSKEILAAIAEQEKKRKVLLDNAVLMLLTTCREFRKEGVEITLDLNHYNKDFYLTVTLYDSASFNTIKSWKARDIEDILLTAKELLEEDY